MPKGSLVEPGKTQAPKMLSRGAWGQYALGMATEAAFILGLSLVALLLAVFAMAVLR